MPAEPLLVLLHERLREEDTDETHIELLNPLKSGWRLGGGEAGRKAISEMVGERVAWTEAAFSAGRLLPRTFCCLSFCLKVFEIATDGANRDRSEPNRMLSYVVWVTGGREIQEQFSAAMDADLRTAQPRPLPQTRPFHDLMQSLLRCLVRDRDRDGLRKLVTWCYGAYEPYHAALVDKSENLDQWLRNAAELLPRLLLKNLLPLHDAVTVREPKIYISTGGGPRGISDPGTLTRRSTLFREIFLESELDALEQTSQRISELFAHTLPIIWESDHTASFEKSRQRILEVARTDGRLRARQLLRAQHFHQLRIPTWLYRDLEREIGELTPTA